MDLLRVDTEEFSQKQQHYHEQRVNDNNIEDRQGLLFQRDIAVRSNETHTVDYEVANGQVSNSDQLNTLNHHTENGSNHEVLTTEDHNSHLDNNEVQCTTTVDHSQLNLNYTVSECDIDNRQTDTYCTVQYTSTEGVGYTDTVTGNTDDISYVGSNVDDEGMVTRRVTAPSEKYPSQHFGDKEYSDAKKHIAINKYNDSVIKGQGHVVCANSHKRALNQTRQQEYDKHGERFAYSDPSRIFNVPQHEDNERFMARSMMPPQGHRPMKVVPSSKNHPDMSSLNQFESIEHTWPQVRQSGHMTTDVPRTVNEQYLALKSFSLSPPGGGPFSHLQQCNDQINYANRQFRLGHHENEMLMASANMMRPYDNQHFYRFSTPGGRVGCVPARHHGSYAHHHGNYYQATQFDNPVRNVHHGHRGVEREMYHHLIDPSQDYESSYHRHEQPQQRSQHPYLALQSAQRLVPPPSASCGSDDYNYSALQSMQEPVVPPAQPVVIPDVDSTFALPSLQVVAQGVNSPPPSPKPDSSFVVGHSVASPDRVPTPSSVHNANFNDPSTTEIAQIPVEKKQSKSRRPKAVPLNSKAIEIMMRWYETHRERPYPTQKEKEEMAKEGEISVTQVKSWFNNKRNRSDNTRPKVQKRKLEEQLSHLCNELLSQSKKPTLNNANIIHELSSLIGQSQCMGANTIGSPMSNPSYGHYMNMY